MSWFHLSHVEWQGHRKWLASRKNCLLFSLTQQWSSSLTLFFPLILDFQFLLNILVPLLRALRHALWKKLTCHLAHASPCISSKHLFLREDIHALQACAKDNHGTSMLPWKITISLVRSWGMSAFPPRWKSPWTWWGLWHRNLDLSSELPLDWLTCKGLA